MMVYLLDVNLLLALCDPNHTHHEAAHHWFALRGRLGWATCPITENGFVRVAGQPAYPSSPGGPDVVRALLQRFRRTGKHQFWPDDISVLDTTRFGVPLPLNPRHVTDVYLLGLAAEHRGKLATLDRRIPLSAVRQGPEAIEWLDV